MTKYKYGNPEAPIVLIQPVGDHDLPEIEGEVAQIRKLTALDFQMIAVKVDDWNLDLSPWRSPAVFGKEDFGGGAASLLEEILRLCSDESKTYYLGGYSLAGLFSLWASYQTDRFAGIAAASPSVWFPGFLPYMKEHENQSRAVYLSLGDKEEKTKNPVMATVGDCIREAHAWLQQCGIRSTLEWNQGNHFRDPGLRTAKAFAWVMKLINFAYWIGGEGYNSYPGRYGITNYASVFEYICNGTAYYEQATLTGTAETGKSIETLRFAEMLSSFAQIPGDVDSTA